MLSNFLRKNFILNWILFLAASSTWAGTVQNGQVVEDFTTINHADFVRSTGVWNIVDHVAQAAIVANQEASRTLSFGNGSDGALISSAGYTFDTNSHPSGYNFTSVSITGGSITVTGSKPLIIRSLGAVTITPNITANGTAGTTGQTLGSTSATGPTGGIAAACASNGGAGGNIATSANSALTGENGKNSTDVYEGGSSGGTGSIIAGTAPGSGSSSALNGPGVDFDAADFVCGVGGGGGGGHFSSAATNATGGSGGGGGGAVRITALGALNIGTLTANGGNGGNAVADTTRCSGNGAGGGGGSVWLQSAKTVTTGVNPTVNAGSGAAAQGGCAGAGGNGVAGVTRADATANPGWPDVYYDTTNAVASQTYYVYSSTFDLGTLNASFTSGPTVSQTTNGGGVVVEFAGSKDDVTYSGFTSNLTALSNQEYRYVRFRISLSTTAGGATPTVSRISFGFEDIGLDSIDLGLSAGCGSIKAFTGGKKGGGKHSKTAQQALFFWALVFTILWFCLRPDAGVRLARLLKPESLAHRS